MLIPLNESYTRVSNLTQEYIDSPRLQENMELQEYLVYKMLKYAYGDLIGRNGKILTQDEFKGKDSNVVISKYAYNFVRNYIL